MTAFTAKMLSSHVIGSFGETRENCMPVLISHLLVLALFQFLYFIRFMWLEVKLSPEKIAQLQLSIALHMLEALKVGCFSRFY